jgi:hypothetical protein
MTSHGRLRITCLDRVGAAVRRLAGGNEVRALPRQHGPAGHAFGRLSPPSRRVGQALTLYATWPGLMNRSTPLLEALSPNVLA